MTQRSAHRNLVLVVVGLGTLLSTLAGSSINLALPVIGRELVVGVQLSRWVVLAFMLSAAVLLLGAGRASDLWGHRRIYQAGFLLFGAASLVSGLAHSLWVLVAGRVLQGAGAALTMSAAPALLTSSVPGALRGRALGIMATATYIGLTIGPPVGGFIIAAVGWRWIFLFNVPACLIMLVVGQLWLPVGERRQVRFDYPGMVTLLLGLPVALLALTQGQEWGWGSPTTLGTALGGAAVLALFVRVELASPQPLLDLSLFRSATFTGAAISAFCNYVAIFVPIILIPFFLLEALRLDTAHAGMLMAVMPLVMAFVASPSGWLSDRVGTRGLAVAGLTALGAALVGLGLRGVCPRQECSIVELGLWMALAGLGTGVFITPNSSALMGSAPRARQGTAGGVLALARTVGMMAGVSMGTAVFHGLGGRTGRDWTSADLSALTVAVVVAGVVSLVGAASAALRGEAHSPAGSGR
jgi:EmrB/QacA subfamily drug resistance transporter